MDTGVNRGENKRRRRRGQKEMTEESTGRKRKDGKRKDES